MPGRVLSVLLLITLTGTLWSSCSAEEVSAPAPTLPQTEQTAPVATPADSAAVTIPDDIEPDFINPPTRPAINFGGASFSADAIPGNFSQRPSFTAKGSVIFKTPVATSMTGEPVQISFFADEVHMATVPMMNAKDVDETEGTTFIILDGALTTCTKPAGHHDYELRAKKFIIYPDKRFEARNVAMVIAGQRLFTIPRINGSLQEGKANIPAPTLGIGTSAIDGQYLGIGYGLTLGNHTDLELDGRIGTKELFRGKITLSRPFDLTKHYGQGTISLVASWHEDVQNRMVSVDQLADERLKNLTITRLPAVQFAVNPIALPFDTPNPMDKYRISFGGSVGRYSEDPTRVTRMRAQTWGIFHTPKFELGPVRLSGEFGVRGAFYGSSAHSAFVTQVSLESPKKSDVYGNISLLRRREAGRTPFLFDRVLIPDELYTELDLPIGKKSPWRLGLANRHDLATGKSRAFAMTAIYGGDCLSYGLTYDTVNRSFGVGMFINGFGSFRRGTPSIGFTQ